MTSAYEQGEIPAIELRHRLRIAREYAGYERDELADTIEVSRNTIGNAESGRTHPRKIMLNAWALACGVPVTWLITGEPPSGGGRGPTSGLGITSPDSPTVIPLTSAISARQRRSPRKKAHAA
jgi:DNA-binding XRE family transcriptional regulator